MGLDAHDTAALGSDNFDFSEEAEYAKTHDVFKYNAKQMAWWRSVVPKDVRGHLVYAALISIFVLAYEAPKNAKIEASLERAVITSFLAALGLAIWYVDLCKGTAPLKGDNKWVLLQDSHGGHFVYLTVNIIVAHTFYWCLCCVGEWNAFVFESDPDSSVLSKHPFFPSRKIDLLEAMFCVSTMTSTLGFVLTLLFLKFNWFEPTWRVEVMEMYMARGQYTFKSKVLFTHIPQLLVAIFDTGYLKRGKLLQVTTPSVTHLLIFNLCYISAYIAWTHHNHYTAKLYAYPIFDKIFSSWKLELPFVLVIGLFCFSVACGFRYLVYV